MIDRYSTKEMSVIWSQENSFKSWLEVEIAVCRAWMEEGSIPEASFRTIVERARVDIDRIRQIEDSVHHDMIAFVSSVAEKVGPDGRFIHLGLTSSDVIDTASSLLLSRSIDIILGELKKVSEAILEKAWQYRKIPCVGRTHGVHAEPISFGFKVLNWYEEIQRDIRRIKAARLSVSVGKISGAVGTYAHCPPAIEERVCALLGLEPARVSTQILQRDRHAEVMTSLALMGSGLERIAVEIRHLQRTEVMEVMEPFSEQQKGSSAMPHKKNPIICERICGMARLLRGYAVSTMENIPLWHERDISHSSVERVIWPDAFNIAHYMLMKTLEVIEGMRILEESMERNLDISKGLVFSQRVLLGLVEKGFSREEAYAVVQKSAMKCWEGDRTFLQILEEDPRIIGSFTVEELESLFDTGYFLRFVEKVFERFPEPGCNLAQ